MAFLRKKLSTTFSLASKAKPTIEPTLEPTIEPTIQITISDQSEGMYTLKKPVDQDHLHQLLRNELTGKTPRTSALVCWNSNIDDIIHCADMLGKTSFDMKASKELDTWNIFVATDAENLQSVFGESGNQPNLEEALQELIQGLTAKAQNTQPSEGNEPSQRPLSTWTDSWVRGSDEQYEIKPLEHPGSG